MPVKIDLEATATDSIPVKGKRINLARDVAKTTIEQ